MTNRYKLCSKLFVLLTFILLSITHFVEAQTGSFGNAHVDAGGELGITSGNHTFQSGIITTNRSATPGYVSFSGTSTYSGASSTVYVDGYVKTYQTGAFTFPIGNSSDYRPVTISASSGVAPTDAAYFKANPTSAGYAITSKGANVNMVSSQEYWDINGTTSTKITLSWGNSTLVADTSTIQIVGWNATASRWEQIPAKVDAGSSTSLGSITTIGTVVPNNYSVYTLGQASSITLACSATQIISTPSVGTPNQLSLIVSANVGSVGSYTVTASGSGMSLANGITNVVATTSGTQKFYIPLNYDGTALGTLTFQVGSTQTCTVDLSSSIGRKTALIDVWTLDNCSIKIAAPILK